MTTGYLRHPTISGDTVVFACEDDLWSVPAGGGTARRLTAGVSEATHPHLSPDGSLVAYVAADDGPTEVHVLPTAGGRARRLTFQDARCVVAGWHPRTGEVIYASTAEQPDDAGFRLFAVAPTGGRTRLLDDGPGASVSFGPAGRIVLGRSNADPARWKRYRGGAIGTLWIDTAGSGAFEPLPVPGNAADPCWVGDRIFFLTDGSGDGSGTDDGTDSGDGVGVGNVHSCRPDGSDRVRHTDHREFYARNLATDGTRLVYHCGAGLYLLDPATGTRPIPVDLGAARAQQGRRFVTAADHLESAELSPDGTALAIVTRGRACTMAHWSGPVRHHGRRPGVRHRLLSWLADGQRLVAVAGDTRPDERLVLLRAGGGAEGVEEEVVEEVELPTGDVGTITALAPSPTSGTVAFATNRQQLWTISTSEPTPPRLLDAGPVERIEDLVWSPDGRWLAYTYPDTLRTCAIKVADVERGESFAVTRPVLRDTLPAFDPLGRYLYFIGRRELTPQPDQVQFDVGFPFGARPYLVTLRAGDPSPFGPGTSTDRADTDDPGTGPPTVEIDLDGIDRRVVALPVPEGRYHGIVALPDAVLLLTSPVAAADPGRSGGEPDTTVTRVELTADPGRDSTTPGWLGPVESLRTAGGSILVRHGDRLRVLDADVTADDAAAHADAAPGARSGWIDLDRIAVAVHPLDEWRQMFREAWRLQRETFWCAGMTGVDWDGMYDRYHGLVELVGSRAELSDLLWELHGELGTSHAYERGGDHRRPAGHPQGFLGIDWDPDPTRWRVGRVLRGDPWLPDATSPCNRPGADVRPGDTVAAIDGVTVGPAGPGELLVGRAEQEVELTLLREGSPPRRVTVRAIGSEARARYLDGVAQRRHLVHATSGGRVGYLHVPDLFHGGYADFVRGFLIELDRDSLVVDLRFNGGGQASPLVLDRLARRRTGTEHGRWSGVAPYPLESPRGPMAALINEQTGSDGEIFAHTFRSLGLGPLVGRRTWGGVIATWPRHPLVDGTVTTQPEFRWYLHGVGDGLENHGVEPDLDVGTAPRLGAPGDGEDVQLAAAVDLLLGGLGAPQDLARPATAHRCDGARTS